MCHPDSPSGIIFPTVTRVTYRLFIANSGFAFSQGELPHPCLCILSPWGSSHILTDSCWGKKCIVPLCFGEQLWTTEASKVSMELHESFVTIALQISSFLCPFLLAWLLHRSWSQENATSCNRISIPDSFPQ